MSTRAERAELAAVLRASEVVTSLAHALTAGTTLAWCVEHAPDGADPLPEAWPLCCNGWAMATVLYRAGHAATPAIERGWREAGCSRGSFNLARFVREHVPALTLTEVLAR